MEFQNITTNDAMPVKLPLQLLRYSNKEQRKQKRQLESFTARESNTCIYQIMIFDI